MFAAALFGCKEDELVKPSALITESSLTFEATNAEPQLLTIASDADWMVDVDSDWISVDQMSGTNTVKVTVSVEDNVDAQGVLAAPRQGIITVANKRGYSVTTTIYQNGDTYLGAPECSVTTAADLDSAARAKVIGAKVAAVATTGFVVTDGTVNMYVEGAADVKTGDVVDFNGASERISGIPSFVLDQIEVKSTSEVTYPAPVSITSAPKALPEKVTYVKLSGTLLSTTLRFTDKTTCTLLVPADAETFNSVNTHKVDVLAYYIGTVKKNVTVVPVSFVDNGQDENIGVDLPYRDDFSWLDPYIAAANTKLAEANKISDCVGAVTSSADGCANIYTTLAKNGCDVIGALRERGYTDLNPEQQTIYLQDAYFKFGKNKCQSGLTLPLFKIAGEQDIVVSFKWCSQLQGDGNIDDTHMVIAIEGPGSIVGAGDDPKVSAPVAHKQGKNEMFWQEASFTITGASTATAITIRPEKFGSVDNPQSGYYRYYMDDIEVMLAADAVKANINISGVENNLITFEGTPEAPAEFTVNADADFNVTSSVNWLHVENGSGLAGATNDVKITCEPSELSVMRKGQITVKAGVSSKSITVIQSAAGQTLEPFISIVGSNRQAVLGEGGNFSIKVQSNTDFEVETSDWISAVPTTKALVETTQYEFKAAVNMTGAARTGYVRFHKGDIESVLVVNQENFVPRVDISAPFTYLGVPGTGGAVTYSIDSNIPFAIKSNASWVTLPADKGEAGTYSIPVTYAANGSADARIAEITISNTEYGYTETIEVKQFPANVMFADDFSWLTPIAKAAGAGDTIGKKDKGAAAPNIYGTAAIKSAFVPLRDAIGYVIPGKSDGANDVVYLQDSYLKMGKTSSNSQTSLTLPGIYNNGKDYVLSFDWARMAQGDGTIDNYTLTLVITGNGTFENGTKYSEEFSTAQGKDELFWTTFSAKIKGADSNTRITFVATALLNKDTGKIDYTIKGGKRMFIDNIKAVAE